MIEKTGIVHDESDPSAGSRTTNMNSSGWIVIACPLERQELSRGEVDVDDHELHERRERVP